MKPVATIERTMAEYPNISRREWVSTIDDTKPSAGMKMIYTSGCPKNQKMCWYNSGSPPSAGFTKCVAMVRSLSSITVLAIITAGIAKITMNDCTSIDQQYKGIRFNDMPGARNLRMVTINSTATHSAEISVKVIICAQISTPLPGENCGPESGV